MYSTLGVSTKTLNIPLSHIMTFWIVWLIMKVTTEENPSQGLVTVTFDFDELSFVHFVVEDFKSWCFFGVGVGVTGNIMVIYSNSLTDIKYMCKTTPKACDLASKVFFVNVRGSKVLKYHLVAYQGDITEH